jgi:hypothetical protein
MRCFSINDRAGDKSSKKEEKTTKKKFKENNQSKSDNSYLLPYLSIILLPYLHNLDSNAGIKSPSDYSVLHSVPKFGDDIVSILYPTHSPLLLQ